MTATKYVGGLDLWPDLFLYIDINMINIYGCMPTETTNKNNNDRMEYPNDVKIIISHKFRE